MSVKIYPPELQGVGSFDHGKFIEQRPIGFPGDQSAVDRVGPLFYWAWGKAIDIAEIGMHPHQAFEIMTYVLQGVVEHQDSLGTKQTVTTGGVQVMQAGSGIYHAEAFREVGSEGFQIWFEPPIRETIHHPPSYHQYHHDQFPSQETDGIIQKTLIGEHAPVQLVTDTRVIDITIECHSIYTYTLSEQRALAVLVIQGEGLLHVAYANTEDAVHSRDFIVIQANDRSERLTLQATSTQPLRIVTIEVPTQVNYPLYRK